MIVDSHRKINPGSLTWPEPIPLAADYKTPPFPTELLPPWLRDWVRDESLATQTPPDLAGLLALAVCGAALAKKFRVRVRDGWAEPTNLFTVITLPPGERKSAVFADALAPTHDFEARERERMAPLIAEAASEHRTLEARLKLVELKAAKAEDLADRERLKGEARDLARELAAHNVPDDLQLHCDDITPESLANLLARQGGRMLLASAEGTAFEVAKGRYSETANFEVFLKGHAGDTLRTNRISRGRDSVEQPALSLALAVQPDVLRGLADQTSMRGRGFLARFLYSMPRSTVGARKVATPPVSPQVGSIYHNALYGLWGIQGATDDRGKPVPHWLRFATAADRLLQDFERWLEPQLAEGEELSFLAGWANKLAGACARIAAVLHVTRAVGEGESWQTPITEDTARVAIALGQDYLLPHAQAAFGLMGADERVESARHVWESITRHCAYSAHSAYAPPTLSRRDIHNLNRRRFPAVEELDPVLELLVGRHLIRPLEGSGQPGRGHRSPAYEVSPLALAESLDKGNAYSAHSAYAPPPPDTAEDDLEEGDA
jgi:hypothetical protein